jgi:trk system potassium uptake protein
MRLNQVNAAPLPLRTLRRHRRAATPDGGGGPFNSVGFNLAWVDGGGPSDGKDMASKGYATLARPVRVRPVLKYLGELLVALAGIAAVPCVVALVAGWNEAALRFAVSCVVLVAAGWLLSRLKADSDIRPNEALVITCWVFLIGALAMTWPLMVAGVRLHDAFFESVSGITTTGLSTIPTDTDLPAVHLFTRAWMQWYGGMAIIVLAVGLLLPPGAVSKGMATGGAMPEGMVGSARLRARELLAIYVALSAAGILVLWGLGMPLFEAVCHALAAISTGGFSPQRESLAAYDRLALQASVMFLCLLGGLSFSLYHRAINGNWRDALSDPACRMLLVSLGISMVLTALFMAISGRFTWLEVLKNAPLMAASAQVTAGFSTVSVPDLDAATKLTMIITMFIGGDAGSTAGGVKIVRLLIILRLIQIMVARTTLPDHAVAELRVYGERIDQPAFERVIGVITLFGLTIILSWLVFLAYGYPPLDSLFDIVSATTTTGLSADVTGPELPVALKIVLALNMLMGRLEVLALCVLLYPGTWIGEKGMI